jgi:hypothetical protein
MKEVQHTLNYFLGTWEINKSVTASPNTDFKAQGYAAFKLFKNDLSTVHYNEKVNIILPSLSNTNIMIGTRKYLYKYDKLTNTISKYFDSGSFFYNLNISNNIFTGEYLCIQDKYYARYVILNKDKFEMTYLVTGPNKNYIINNIYARTNN